MQNIKYPKYTTCLEFSEYVQIAYTILEKKYGQLSSHLQIIRRLVKFRMRLRIYYHIYCNKVSETIVQEQVRTICSSPLWDKVESVECCVTGDDLDSYNSVLKFLKKNKFNIRKSGMFNDTFERFTLDALLRDADINYAYLYMHSKGCTVNGRRGTRVGPVRSWRRCMEYFLIERFPQGVESLLAGKVDTVGIFVRTVPQLHYSGNFWWASGRYLIRRFSESPTIGQKYIDPEMYLLDTSPPAKSVNLYENTPPLDLYEVTLPRSAYELVENSSYDANFGIVLTTGFFCVCMILILTRMFFLLLLFSCTFFFIGCKVRSSPKVRKNALCVISTKNPTQMLLDTIDNVQKFYPEFKIAVIDSDSTETDIFDQVPLEVDVNFCKNKNWELGAWCYAFDTHPNYTVYMFIPDTLQPIARIKDLNIYRFTPGTLYSVHYKALLKDGGHFDELKQVYKDTSLNFISELHPDTPITGTAHTSFLTDEANVKTILQLEQAYIDKKITKSKLHSWLSERTGGLVAERAQNIRRDMSPFFKKIAGGRN